MENNREPKLRTVNKSVPPFALNNFPKQFPFKVGEQLIYILATRGAADIEGKEWEQIFAKSIDADWKPSNVGLDDIVLGNTAWGAKSVKFNNPSKKKEIRLISGRNDLINSFDYNVQPGELPDEHGLLVLSIWNERVSSIRKYYKHLRTIILIRSYDLLESVIFEFDTIRYDPELYYWKWKGKNLYGYQKKDDKQKFTWQSGGQQFTVFEAIPENFLIINLRKPEIVEKDFILDKIGFDPTWITVRKNG
ncbi:hypothetical protein [Flavobacterium subsaxonicum]|uniref:Uncharacterized protein n=1 Tax=Flavobacterium subsaxonicum WB 4.1-42 = DSM 21790 TaxID=1121898 RepID=A0A0A2MHJ2_9FLAO|nr:hypothetical protein [Flavobacterium subsaxonicum]KGO91076.1 hypothetical protein Q766_19940 [Flavobacterium subsaxonicum WB 4.1-42 = DSM 21790]